MNRIDFEREYTNGWRAYIAGEPAPGERKTHAQINRARGWREAERAEAEGRDIRWVPQAKKGGA